MSRKPSTDLLATADEIQAMVHVVRGQRVMLDFDLARLYGVTTTRSMNRSLGTANGSQMILRIPLHSKRLQS